MDRSVAAVKVYSVWEEVLNSVSHGIGIVFGAIALVLLILRAIQLHESQYMASAIIYGSSIILLFAASTLYHAIPHRGTKQVFRVIDHSAIYLLIAGSYTPFLLLTMSDAFGVVLMVIVWTLAVAGVIFKVFFVNRFHNLSLITYLGMGWLSLVAAYELATNLPARANALLLTGGLVYSVGTVFYRFKRIPFNHAIWHLFVLGGCVCHFLAVYYFVLTP